MHTGYEEDRELCGDSDRCGENIARIEGPLILYEEIGGFFMYMGKKGMLRKPVYGKCA